MPEFIRSALSSPLIVMLAAAYLATAAVTTFDVRLIQAKRRGEMPPDEPLLPKWVAGVHWIEWGLLITLLVLNWKFALALWATKFVLKILPVLELVGNVLMSPFKPRQSRQPADAVVLPAGVPQNRTEADALARSLRARLGEADEN